MLLLATVVFAFVACNDSDKELIVTDGLQYTLSSNGMYYSISGYSGTESDVIIGKTYNSKPVREISSSAFKNNTEITSIKIPDSVKSIGKGAFENCGSLTSKTFPDSVTGIDDYAFGYCSSLTSINVGENNQSYKAIDGNLYTKDGVTLIQYAIGKTETSFVIPDSVTSIGSYAFNGCSSLTSVAFENTSGWWYASSSTATNGTSISSVYLAKTSTAAEYLTSTYRRYYWKRS